jgi:hypothetical protein
MFKLLMYSGAKSVNDATVYAKCDNRLASRTRSIYLRFHCFLHLLLTPSSAWQSCVKVWEFTASMVYIGTLIAETHHGVHLTRTEA